MIIDFDMIWVQEKRKIIKCGTKHINVFKSERLQFCVGCVLRRIEIGNFGSSNFGNNFKEETYKEVTIPILNNFFSFMPMGIMI